MKEIIIVSAVKNISQRQLFHLADAMTFSCRLAGCRKCRQEHGRQNRYYRNYYKQLDECKFR